MRAACLFLRVPAVIQYVLRAESTLENTDGEQRALCKFSWWDLDLSLLHCEKKRFALLVLNLADIVQQILAAYNQLCLVSQTSISSFGFDDWQTD